MSNQTTSTPLIREIGGALVGLIVGVVVAIPSYLFFMAHLSEHYEYDDMGLLGALCIYAPLSVAISAVLGCIAGSETGRRETTPGMTFVGYAVVPAVLALIVSFIMAVTFVLTTLT